MIQPTNQVYELISTKLGKHKQSVIHDYSHDRIIVLNSASLSVSKLQEYLGDLSAFAPWKPVISDRDKKGDWQILIKKVEVKKDKSKGSSFQMPFRISLPGVGQIAFYHKTNDEESDE